MMDLEDPEIISSKLVAELPLALLKAGLDIIKSPGRNENPEFDKVTENVSVCLFY